MKILLEGSIHGDYSLAIVNRNIASALRKLGHEVSLFAANSDFSQVCDDIYVKEQGLSALILSAEELIGNEDFDLHLFNDWPVQCRRRGTRLGAACWAWEESHVPSSIIDTFNSQFDFVAVASTYTERALLDSGLRIAVWVCGEGVDHASTFSTQATYTDREEVREWSSESDNVRHAEKAFRFVHISSCFWRKGVDVLISAFDQEFDAWDNVELIIKTFPNPHNGWLSTAIAGMSPLNQQRTRIVNESLDSKELFRLLSSSDCAVYPTRGEGFLLPAAEALAQGVLLIVTDKGGQADFCNTENALLVKSRKVNSISHVAAAGSEVFEPEIDSLRRQLRRALHLPAKERNRIVEQGRRAASLLTWQNTAVKIVDGRSELLQLDTIPPRSIALVSTWATECGIATYSRSLLLDGRLDDLFAEIHAEIGNTSTVYSDDVSWTPAHIRVMESWSRTATGIRQLVAALTQSECPVVFFQHHFGIFSSEDLGVVARACKAAGKVFIAEMHNFPSDVDYSNLGLASIDILLVHRLADMGHIEGYVRRRVTVFRHGITDTSGNVAPTYGPSVPSVRIVSFGFALPHKKYERLISLACQLKSIGLDIDLRIYSSVRKDIRSLKYVNFLRSYAITLGVSEEVSIDTSYQSLRSVEDAMRNATMAVFPYENVDESASGAARVALSAGVPLLVSNAHVFSEFGTQVQSFRSDTELLLKATRLIYDLDFRQQVLESQFKLITQCSFRSMGSEFRRIVSQYLLEQS